MSTPVETVNNTEFSVPINLLLRREIVNNIYRESIDESRRDAAKSAVRDISTQLQENEQLVDCRPVTYRETLRNKARGTEKLIKEIGALVFRCQVQDGNRQYRKDIWINDQHRPLDEQTIVFGGLIATEGQAVDDVWEVTHLSQDSVALSHTPFQRAFALATVTEITPAATTQPSPDAAQVALAGAA